MEEKDKELWNLIEREIDFVKSVRQIMATESNYSTIGELVKRAFNKMNEKIE